MTKNEFIAELIGELKRNEISDAEEIVSEYEQHFAFKLADGYSEEEISAKLGSPQAIAAQYENIKECGKRNTGGGFLIKILSSFTAVFEAMFYILFFAWIIGILAGAAASAAVGICLIGNINVAGIIPYMPYSGALIFGISFLALAVLFYIVSYYCFAYTRQMIRASVRWHNNMTSAAPLPPLPWSPQLKGKTRRALRSLLLWSVSVFGAAFVLAYVVLALQAGALGFWHVWNWFV